MGEQFTPILVRPRNRGWGAEGDLWYQGANGIWTSIPHPGVAGQTLISTIDGWATGEGGGAGGEFSVRTETADYTATADDNIILVDTSAGDVTITMPPATSVEGRFYAVVKIDDSGNEVTIEGDGTEEINGELNATLDREYECITLISNGSFYVILSHPGVGTFRATGFGCQFGDGFAAIESAGAEFLIHTPYTGMITRIILRANAACNAEVDILKNGTSIFTGTAVKPTLSGSAVDDKTSMTDITTDIAIADQFLMTLDSVSLDPNRLSLTVFTLQGD